MSQRSFWPTEDAITEEVRPIVHRVDPVTSLIAARELVETGELGRQQRIVLEALQNNAGLTSDELAAAARLDRYLVARRLPDLVRLGVARQGERRTSTLSGRPGVTWFPVKSSD